VATPSIAGRSCLHYVQSWKSDANSAAQRLAVIDFLINECGANVNVQVTCRLSHSGFLH